jgi:hypothetical protein
MKKKLVAVVLIIICLTSIVSATYLVLSNQPQYVTSKEMETYATSFMVTYYKELDFFNATEKTYFFLHPNSYYNVTAFISSSYGTAILIQPSDRWIFNLVQSKQRVEEMIFGGDLSKDWPMFQIPENGHHIFITALGSVYPYGSATTNGHPFIEVDKNGTVILEFYC